MTPALRAVFIGPVTYIPSGSRYGNVPNELVHRAGPPFLDNHYHCNQYVTGPRKTTLMAAIINFDFQLTCYSCIALSLCEVLESGKPSNLANKKA